MNKFIYNNGKKGGFPYIGVRGDEPLTPYRTGEESPCENEFNYNRNAAVEVKTAEELVAALSQPGRVYVEGEIEVTEPIVVAEGKTTVSLKKDAVIKSSLTGSKDSVFKLDSKDSELVIEGDGKIESEKDGIFAKLGKVTINGGEFACKRYAIKTFDNVAGEALENKEDVQVTINGGKFDTEFAPIASFGGIIVINGGELNGKWYAMSCNGTNGWNNCDMTINDGKFVGLEPNDCAAIYWPSKGTLTINDGEFVGASALYLKTGNVIINGGKFEANGEKRAYQYSGSGFNATGDAVVIDRCFYPGGDADVVINEGEFISAAEDTDGIAIYYGNGDSPELTTGKLKVKSGIEYREYIPN